MLWLNDLTVDVALRWGWHVAVAVDTLLSITISVTFVILYTQDFLHSCCCMMSCPCPRRAGGIHPTALHHPELNIAERSVII